MIPDYPESTLDGLAYIVDMRAVHPNDVKKSLMAVSYLINYLMIDY